MLPAGLHHGLTFRVSDNLDAQPADRDEPSAALIPVPQHRRT